MVGETNPDPETRSICKGPAKLKWCGTIGIEYSDLGLSQDYVKSQVITTGEKACEAANGFDYSWGASSARTRIGCPCISVTCSPSEMGRSNCPTNRLITVTILLHLPLFPRQFVLFAACTC
jgi:hypothetical protein